ncbi:membrane-associated progesterone receptor component 1-like [Vespa velutina]|uniref:membrane-associated progesterone receptor component 1-like n=1 Tax=Vespa velutina TaxID=202808 RepID=UPI001FB4C499|nr:membrane-associated progesterone receptor component 1-like [Vespa velutina]
MAEKSDSITPGSTSATFGQQNNNNSLFLTSFVEEIIKSPINLLLVGIIALLVYKIIKSKIKSEEPLEEIKHLPKLHRDFTIEELKKYDGNGTDGRILVALNGSVYDVTRGATFYGPGAPYAVFAGRDASRGLATFTLEPIKDEYDDLSDLDSEQMSSMKEWELQFKERYDYVGKLLKPGEEPTNYSDEEDEGSQQETENKLDQQNAKSDICEIKNKAKDD